MSVRRRSSGAMSVRDTTPATPPTSSRSSASLGEDTCVAAAASAVWFRPAPGGKAAGTQQQQAHKQLA